VPVVPVPMPVRCEGCCAPTQEGAGRDDRAPMPRPLATACINTSDQRPGEVSTATAHSIQAPLRAPSSRSLCCRPATPARPASARLRALASTVRGAPSSFAATAVLPEVQRTR
jgi:hypothetical protein